MDVNAYGHTQSEVDAAIREAFALRRRISELEKNIEEEKKIIKEYEEFIQQMNDAKGKVAEFISSAGEAHSLFISGGYNYGGSDPTNNALSKVSSTGAPNLISNAITKAELKKQEHEEKKDKYEKDKQDVEQKLNNLLSQYPEIS